MSEQANTEIDARQARPRKPRKPPRPRVLIEEPINYDQLAAAYKAAHWRWHDGYPTAERLKAHFGGAKLFVARRGPPYCCDSGRMDIKWIDGKIVLLVPAELAAHYAQ